MKDLAWCLAHSKCSIIVGNFPDIVDIVIVNGSIISLSL